jgi:hypothetical protein
MTSYESTTYRHRQRNRRRPRASCSVLIRENSRRHLGAMALKDWQRCDELCVKVTFPLMGIGGQNLLFR